MFNWKNPVKCVKLVFNVLARAKTTVSMKKQTKSKGDFEVRLKFILINFENVSKC